MATEKTATDIRQRFLDEQEYVARYTKFLRQKSIIHDHQIKVLNRILKRAQLDPLPTRKKAKQSEPYSGIDLQNLLLEISRTTPHVYQAIRGLEERLDDVPKFDTFGPAARGLDRLGEWVDYLQHIIPDDAEEQDDEAILKSVMAEVERETDGDNEDAESLTPEETRAVIEIAIQTAKYNRAAELVDSLEYALDQFDHLRLMARVAQPNAEVHVFRQGFLLLMTAFDAAVFDLFRIALRTRFFQLVGMFGKQEKVTLAEIGEAGSLEVFQDAIIEDQLRRRYVKDLLALLQQMDVGLVDESRGDKYVHLVELVQRRNVHVHNRGVVDERYLESNHNLFNLKLGDVAHIDLNYLDTANRLCENCVNRLADWANG